MRNWSVDGQLVLHARWSFTAGVVAARDYCTQNALSQSKINTVIQEFHPADVFSGQELVSAALRELEAYMYVIRCMCVCVC